VALALAMNKRLKEDRENRALRESVEELFRELLDELPEECASIQRKSEGRSVLLELLPSRPNAASICVIVPADEHAGVTLIAGRGSFFEIPKSGRRYTGLPLIDEMRSICLAVIAGRLEEWVVLDGAEVLEGKGVIELPQPLTVRWRQLSFRPFRKKLRMHYRYEPWVAAGQIG